MNKQLNEAKMQLDSHIRSVSDLTFELKSKDAEIDRLKKVLLDRNDEINE